MKLNNLAQGSQEWLEYRKKKIGASDAPIIMKASPWCTPYQLWERKLGLKSEPEPSFVMQRGIDREPIILAWFNEHYNCNCVPIVVEHSTIDYMIASIDGYDANQKIAVEIKTCGKDDFENYYKLGKCPYKYFWQLQHQMFVLDIDSIHVVAEYNENYAAFRVHRCNENIDKLLVEVDKFWKCMQLLTPPDFVIADYQDMNESDQWKIAAENYRNFAMLAKEYSEAEKVWRKRLLELAGDRCAFGNGVTATMYMSRGTIDYNAIPELKNIDLEQYRKQSKTSWRLTINE